MKSLYLLLATAQVCNSLAASEVVQHLVDNQGDQLFTLIYPNPNKETVILLHGGPGFPSDLLEVAAMLQPYYQVVTFHQRGTQKSPCPSKDYSMEAYISDVDAVAAYFGLQRFHLWGHSWGGLYAQIYADKHPEKLLSLFLCCPGSGTGAQWRQTEKEVMQLNKSKSTSWQWMQMGIHNVFGILGSDAAYKKLFRQVMKNYNTGFIDVKTIDIDFDNLKAAPINKTRPQIVQYPVLQRQLQPAFRVTVVYGDQDIYTASKNFVIERYPTAAVHTIPNCGHIPWLHNPDAYQQVLNMHYDTDHHRP